MIPDADRLRDLMNSCYNSFGLLRNYKNVKTKASTGFRNVEQRDCNGPVSAWAEVPERSRAWDAFPRVANHCGARRNGAAAARAGGAVCGIWNVCARPEQRGAQWPDVRA